MKKNKPHKTEKIGNIGSETKVRKNNINKEEQKGSKNNNDDDNKPPPLQKRTSENNKTTTVHSEDITSYLWHWTCIDCSEARYRPLRYAVEDGKKSLFQLLLLETSHLAGAWELD